MRFQIPLTQWDHPLGQPIEALAPAIAPVGHLGLRGGGKGSSPLVYIAAGGHEIGLWDIEEGNCHQVCHKVQAVMQLHSKPAQPKFKMPAWVCIRESCKHACLSAALPVAETLGSF